jgi:Tol biopolymer transport system component
MPLLKDYVPLDISADGSELLLGQRRKGVEDGLSLWASPALGGPPRRIGDLRVVDARWSPRGDQILFCDAKGLQLAQGDGSGSRVIARPPGYVHYLAWSPDGRFIRFTSDFNGIPYLFEISADGSGLHRLSLGTSDIPGQTGVWTADAKYFLFSGSSRNGSDIWVIANGTRLSLLTGIEWSGARHRGSAAVRLTNGPLLADHPEPALDDRRVFFRGRLNKGALVRYDAQSRKWTPYMDGLSGMQLDFSRDGKWITYARFPDGSVWRSAVDGTNRRQLTTSAIFARNPRWSPDGTQIVFYGAPPGESERVYLVSAEGGPVRQLTHSDSRSSGNEGDGNWSPDSRLIAFSIAPDPHLDGRAADSYLATIDVKNGYTAKLEGSEALWSPRWSPDGRYFAAMKSPDSTLWLYDPVAHQQTQLTTLSASWPHWSHDSHYVYFSNHLHTYRVNIRDRKVESVADFDGLKTPGESLGWIGLAPDDSLISTRDAGSTEIYALNWENP